MSTGPPKSGPPAHANRIAFHHNRASKTTARILALPLNSHQTLCPHCVVLMDWRKKYRKYKPLTVPKRCVACGEKKIKEAYHVACTECARKTNTCAKCRDSREQDDFKNKNPVDCDSEDLEVDK